MTVEIICCKYQYSTKYSWEINATCSDVTASLVGGQNPVRWIKRVTLGTLTALTFPPFLLSFFSRLLHLFTSVHFFLSFLSFLDFLDFCLESAVLAGLSVFSFLNSGSFGAFAESAATAASTATAATDGAALLLLALLIPFGVSAAPTTVLIFLGGGGETASGAAFFLAATDGFRNPVVSSKPLITVCRSSSVGLKPSVESEVKMQET